MESLEALLSHVEKAAVHADRGTVLRAQTAIEELFANSVLYGNRDSDAQASVWLSVTDDHGVLKLRYEDAFAAFDPFQNLDAAATLTEMAIEHRPIGGLGRLLVYQLADQARYARNGDRNCIQLLFGPRPAAQ
jgi:anti-sigma regulatory factor (Ser/Thr protein kinase)